MFSHVTVGTNDLAVSAAFYDALLAPLGLRRRQVTPDGGPPSACWVSPGGTLPRFYVYAPFNRETASSGNGSMVAFLAPSAAAVDAAYAAGMTAAAATRASRASARTTESGTMGRTFGTLTETRCTLFSVATCQAVRPDPSPESTSQLQHQVATEISS
jgi:catechol 2,3-dioxygenase-like lactoylglutathione lyase family enzyme